MIKGKLYCVDDLGVGCAIAETYVEEVFGELAQNNTNRKQNDTPPRPTDFARRDCKRIARPAIWHIKAQSSSPALRLAPSPHQLPASRPRPPAAGQAAG